MDLKFVLFTGAYRLKSGRTMNLSILSVITIFFCIIQLRYLNQFSDCIEFLFSYTVLHCFYFISKEYKEDMHDCSRVNTVDAKAKIRV